MEEDCLTFPLIIRVVPLTMMIHVQSLLIVLLLLWYILTQMVYYMIPRIYLQDRSSRQSFISEFYYFYFDILYNNNMMSYSRSYLLSKS